MVIRNFDIHAHIFPSKIAGKAVHAIGHFYHMPMEGGGSSEGLLRHGRRIGTQGYAVHSAATTPDQVCPINDFIAQQASVHPEFIGFATLHPAMNDPEAEIERALRLGLLGVKLHPDFQQFYLDDPAALRLFRLLEGRLPVLVHMGDESRDYSAPRRLAQVLDHCPDLQVIAAHMGGYRQWGQARRWLADAPVHFDTSSCLFALCPQEAADMIGQHGAGRVLFGTDYPMWLHEEEIERFMALPLSKQAQRDILWNNAIRLLGLEDWAAARTQDSAKSV